MREIPEEVLYDTRLIERHINEGLITQAQVDERLAAAEDATEEADMVDVEAMYEEILESRRAFEAMLNAEPAS